MEFPSTARVPEPVLQYMEITEPDEVYNTLMVRYGDDTPFATWLVDEEVLRNTAMGNNEIGFLRWVIEAVE
jgi:hypothetical protein